MGATSADLTKELHRNPEKSGVLVTYHCKDACKKLQTDAFRDLLAKLFSGNYFSRRSLKTQQEPIFEK